MKFSANLSFLFPEFASLEERYQAASYAGFRGVEVAFPYSVPASRLKEIKESVGLEQVLLNTEPGDNLGFLGRPTEEQQFLGSLTRSLEYCKLLGCTRLHIMAGRKMEGVSRDQAIKTMRSNLMVAVPLLKEAGVIGLIEPINPWSLPQYNMDSFPLAVDLVKEFSSPWLRLQLDLFHLQQLQGNVTRSIEELMPLVGHVQIAQVPGRGEPDSPGELDYSYILGQLDRLEYEGWVGLEYNPTSTTVEGLAWLKRWGYRL